MIPTPTRLRRSRTVPEQFAEMAVAVPQVVSHRVMRMALAGHSPSARDRAEFQRMGHEKTAAFFESWWAMGLQAWAAQQQFAASLMRQAFWPWALLGGSAPGAWQQLAQAGTGVLSRGLAPVHRRAVANARRLGRTPLR